MTDAQKNMSSVGATAGILCPYAIGELIDYR